MKALIFGSNGQDGYYLNKLLNKNNIEVFTVSRNNALVKGDINDFYFVNKIIKEYQPNYIFSFAANSTTKHEVIFENYSTIVDGSLNILEAVKINELDTKIFLSGSGLQFKNENNPIDEASPFHANSAYSSARIASTYLARYYREKHQLNTYVGYFFNHDSPLRSEKHLNQKIIQFFKNIKNHPKQFLEIGDLAAKKEFGFAGDIVEAVWKLVNQNQFCEAVIGTGKAYSIEEWLNICANLAKVNWRDYVIPNLGFQSEYKILVSNPSLIKTTGWTPLYDIEDLANLMWETEEIKRL